MKIEIEEVKPTGPLDNGVLVNLYHSSVGKHPDQLLTLASFHGANLPNLAVIILSRRHG